jgi:drug/metabolite transporter (DMT)-like permease
VILGVVVAVLWGSCDLLATLASRRSGAFRTLATAQIAELIVCAAAWVAFRPSLAGAAGSVPTLLAAGVLTAAAYGALYRGLMLGPVMIVAPVASAYAVGPTVLAVIVLGEHLSVGAAVGATIAIAGVIVVTAARGNAVATNDADGRSGVGFGIVAMLGFAASAFLVAAFAQRVGWFAAVLLSRVGVVLTLVVVGVSLFLMRGQRNRPHPDRRAGTLAVLAGLGNLVGTSVYAYAGERNLIAVATAVSAMFPLVPVLGGFVLFRERIGRLQTAGIAVIIVGMVLLS